MWQEDRLRPGVQVQPGQHRETPSLKKERERERGREEERKKEGKKERQRKRKKERERKKMEVGRGCLLRLARSYH